MKNKLFLLIAFTFSLFIYGFAYEITFVDNPPLETIALKLPDNECANWKEICRRVTEKEGLVERIPVSQTFENWSELIRIQHDDTSHLNSELANSVENFLDRIHEAIISAYPGNKVSWKIIEKNKSDIIYEWILHKPYKDVPPQHEVARAFLTKTGLHTIAFTRQKVEMSLEEREKCIRLLKESASIISYEKASNDLGVLSLADRCKNSLDLGSFFQSWKVINTDMTDSGYAMVCRVPPSQSKLEMPYVTECLEVMTMPNVQYFVTMDQLFGAEKENIQRDVPAKVEFRILKKSPDEVIYFFSYPKDHLQLNVVNRSFVSDRGYYSIQYRRGHAEELKKEEVQLWKERLESIKLRNFSMSLPESKVEKSVNNKKGEEKLSELSS